MFSYFKSLFFSRTGKDTAVVFVGTLINVITGGLFFILTPRFLGPADYGLFSTVVATGLMATTIANFGIDTGILRFAKGEQILNKILSLALKSYLFIGFGVAVIGILLSDVFANFLGHPQIATLLKIAFSATILLLLTNLFVAGLQAKREFLKASLVNISSNFLRLLIFIVAAYFWTIGLLFVTALFFLVSIASVALGKILLPFELEKLNKEKFFDFHKYNFWVALALIISSIPFDNYFLLKLAGATQTGIYYAPFKVLTFGYQFGGNFTRVLASRVVAFKNSQDAKEFIFKASSFPLLFIFVLGFLILISRFVVQFLFGPDYLSAIPIFQILSLGFIFFFAATIPSSIILYYFGKSNVSFVITLARYLTFILMLILLVPQKAAIGAAIAFSASEFFSFILMTLYVILNFKKPNAS